MAIQNILQGEAILVYHGIKCLCRMMCPRRWGVVKLKSLQSEFPSLSIPLCQQLNGLELK